MLSRQIIRGECAAAAVLGDVVPCPSGVSIVRTAVHITTVTTYLYDGSVDLKFQIHPAMATMGMALSNSGLK